MSVYEVIRRQPKIPIVRDRSRAMAMVDAIMSPDWGHRFYSFDSPDVDLAALEEDIAQIGYPLR
ncbi:hypothetical protein HCJ76_06900 [Streptomyces sp. MC1]|uniref:hypothetical protein n=1 Tax=Streptomyces sp. MC1 TaxID=295105 RepID=UPI0018CB95E0|nr:hypothetical protein [Streptomyces sp. MC1]MBG7697817.1 hypothetical protein [Streptomyces sp. MC1]